MEEKKTQLPENAQRELKPGEEYMPLLSPKKNYPEVTPWSVSLGIIMTVIFSAAAAYLGLKVGQAQQSCFALVLDKEFLIRMQHLMLQNWHNLQHQRLHLVGTF